jgi:heme-degrading monooxygenase HmoA
MYAAVNRISFQAGGSDQGLAMWQQQIVPRMRQQPGFRGVFLMRDTANNRGMGITLWDSEADFQAAFGKPEAQAMFRELQARVFAGPPERENYEVVLNEWA